MKKIRVMRKEKPEGSKEKKHERLGRSKMKKKRKLRIVIIVVEIRDE